MAGEGDAERLVVLLEARIGDFERNMAKANATAAKNWTAIEARSKQAGARIQRQTEQASAGVLASFGKMGSGITKALAVFGIGGIGIGLGVQIAKSIRSVVAESAHLVDVADKIGITTKALQELRFAGSQAGIEIEDMDQALAKFSVNLGEASRGGGDLYDILKANGIAIRDAAGNVRPLIDLFTDYANLVQNAGSVQERNTLVVKAFGKAADEMGNLFADGAKGIDQARDAAVKLGAVIDDAKLRRIAEIDDKWDAFATTLRVNVHSAILDIVDDFDTVLDRMNKIEDQKDKNVRQQLQRVYDQRTALQEQITELEDELANNPMRGKQLIQLDLTEAKAQLETLTQEALKLRDILDRRHGLGADEEPTPAKPKTILPPEGEAKKARDATADVIEQLRFEQEQLGRTAEQQELYNELKRAGVELNSVQGQQIAELVTQNQALEQSQQRLKESAQFFGETMVDALDNIIVKGGTAEDAMKNLFHQIASALLQAALLGQGSLGNIFGAGASGGAPGGFVGALLTPRAAGGPIDSGRPYLVGERGPELVVPRNRGMVIPNGRAGGTINFAPSTVIHVTGGGNNDNLRRELDRRDRRILDELPTVLRRHQMTIGCDRQ